MCKTIHQLYSAFTGHSPERNMQCKELLYTFSPWPQRTWQYYHDFNDYRVKKKIKTKKSSVTSKFTMRMGYIQHRTRKSCF